MYKIVVLIFILSTAMAFEDCGSKTGRPTDVSIEGCSPDATCILKRGGNATVHIQFIADQGSRSIASVVHGIIQGVTVPFHFPYPDGCAYGGLQCPLVANQSYTYSATLPIKRIYPAIGNVTKNT
ncbi:hypothetical protein B566_EDAN006306 [Ephemera danica]|nr:hypothetical protein B566_EDAN006306 [Ephemera danica]